MAGWGGSYAAVSVSKKKKKSAAPGSSVNNELILSLGCAATQHMCFGTSGVIEGPTLRSPSRHGGSPGGGCGGRREGQEGSKSYSTDTSDGPAVGPVNR